MRAPGENVDGTVRGIATAYDQLGRTHQVTSYGDTDDNGTLDTVRNQVQYAYDDYDATANPGGWGAVGQTWQEHDGAVNTSTSPSVGYDYDASLGRLTAISHPSGWQYGYDYGTAGSIDDRLSRIAAISAGTVDYAAYTYLGAGTIVESSRPDVAGGLVLGYGDSADGYSGFDRFGRVVDQHWQDDSGSTTLDRYTYGYNRVGNRTFRDNELHAAFDETYAYDELYRLIGSARADGFDQDWNLDGLGNWDGFDDDGTAQTRQVNAANEISGITGGSVTPEYDAAGNTTAMPSPAAAADRLFAVYDGWNRLVELFEDTDADGTFEPATDDTPVAQYEYDGLNRRIAKQTDWSGSAWGRQADYFYNENWQLLEARTSSGGTTSVDQYVWDISYIDAPVMRAHNADGDGYYDHATDFIHYYTWDANQNVTAAIDLDGTVAARYAYTPYGEATEYDAAWANPAASTADGPLYAGYHFDAEAGLYHVRHRQYHPTLGTFTTRDPIGYAAGDENLYRYVGNDPTGAVDPQGLWTEEGVIEAYAQKYGDNELAMRGMLGVLAIYRLEQGTHLWSDDWDVDHEKQIIYICDDSAYFWTKSDSNAASQLYQVLADEFYPVTGLPEGNRSLNGSGAGGGIRP